MAAKDRAEKPSGLKSKAKRPRESKEDTNKKAKPVPQNHKEQHELKIQRKIASNPNFTLIQELKALWEHARQKRLTSKERQPKIARMLGLAKGHLKDIIFQHDSARVVQCMIRYGNAEQRAAIHAELVEHTVELSKSKYSRHIVPKLLQYGTRPQRDAIVAQYYGHVRRLMRQKIASEILAAAYIDYATSAQRSNLIAEFYGPQFALFKNETTKSLAHILEEQPAKRPFILKHIKQAIQPMLEKGLCSHLILHRALREYLEVVDGDERTNMIDSIKELVVEMLHSRDGAKVGILCLKHTGAKDRKIMLRSFKPYIAKIAQEEYGYMVLLAALDVVDDTVLLKKMVLQEMEESIMELATNLYSRKVLLYLSAHRSRQHFLPDVIAQLSALDDNDHSKKDMAARRQQIIQNASPMLLKLVEDNAADLCIEGQTALLVQEILSNCVGDSVPAMTAIAQAAVSGETPLVHDAAGHRFLRKMVDKNIRSEDRTFTSVLVEHLVNAGGQSELFKLAKTNRSAFVILRILESTTDEASAHRMQSELSSFPTHLATVDAKKKNPPEPTPGTKLILKRLAGEETGQHSRSESAKATKAQTQAGKKAASSSSSMDTAVEGQEDVAATPKRSRSKKAVASDDGTKASKAPKASTSEESEAPTPRRSARKRKPVKRDG